MCWFVFVSIVLPSLLMSAKCTEPSNWFPQIKISTDLFGRKKDPKELLKDYHMTRITFGVSASILICCKHAGETACLWFLCPLSISCSNCGEVIFRRWLFDWSWHSSRCHWIAKITPGAIPQGWFYPPQMECKWANCFAASLSPSEGLSVNPTTARYHRIHQDLGYLMESQLRPVLFDRLQVTCLRPHYQTTSCLRHRQDVWCFGMVFSLSCKGEDPTSTLLGAETRLGWSYSIRYTWCLVQLAVWTPPAHREVYSTLQLWHTSQITSWELHGFCDVSEHGYATVVHLRMTDPHGKVQVTLVTSKTKVAQIKQLTIPCLELCGAHLLAHLLHHVCQVLLNVD